MYDVDLRQEAFEFLLALPEDEQHRLLLAARAIGADPFAEPDFEGHTDEGPLRGDVVGVFAILYHVDHAVRRIRVVDITYADRI